MNGFVDEQLWRTYETQIAASDGTYPLLGTMLLDGNCLHIDYGAKTVGLT